MDQTRKSDTIYGYVVVGLLILAVIVVGALWIMERRRAAHLAELLRVEREAVERSNRMIQQLLDAAEGTPPSPGPTAPPVEDAP